MTSSDWCLADCCCVFVCLPVCLFFVPVSGAAFDLPKQARSVCSMYMALAFSCAH